MVGFSLNVKEECDQHFDVPVTIHICSIQPRYRRKECNMRYPTGKEKWTLSKRSRRKMDRRTFLKIAGGAAVVTFATGAGYDRIKPEAVADILPSLQKPSVNEQLLPEVFAKEQDLPDECTTIIVGKNATADGSVLLAHNQDPGMYVEANAYIVPHQTHAPGEVYKSFYGDLLPQPPETYGYVWIGVPDVAYYPGDFYIGINEYQVTICEDIAASRESWGPGWFMVGPGGYPAPPQIAQYKMIWTDFMHLVMQRCKTAREAVELIGSFTDGTYGGDITSSGDLHGIADKNEGWIVEKTPHHWCAKRVPDDGYLRDPNRYTIDTPDLGSADLQSFAQAQGWWDGTAPFSFKNAYGVPSTQNAIRNIYRERRIDSLLQPKLGSVRLDDLKAILRDHYEGLTDSSNPPYYHADAHGSPHYSNPFRTLCVSSTCTSYVAELRSFLPDPIGGVMWATLGSPCTSVYLPYYVGTQSVPIPFTTGSPGLSNYNPASAWWTYELLKHTIDYDYPAAEPHVRALLDTFEKGTQNDSKEVEQKALNAYQAGKTQEALSILNAFTTSKLNDGLDLLCGMITYANAKTHGLYPSIPGAT